MSKKWREQFCGRGRASRRGALFAVIRIERGSMHRPGRSCYADARPVPLHADIRRRSLDARRTACAQLQLRCGRGHREDHVRAHAPARDVDHVPGGDEGGAPARRGRVPRRRGSRRRSRGPRGRHARPARESRLAAKGERALVARRERRRVRSANQRGESRGSRERHEPVHRRSLSGGSTRIARGPTASRAL